MGHWNHRILATEHVNPWNGTVSYHLTFHEVYYDDTGQPNGYGNAAISGESVRDLTWHLTKRLKARKKPILWAGYRFPEEFKENVNLDKLNV